MPWWFLLEKQITLYCLRIIECRGLDICLWFTCIRRKQITCIPKKYKILFIGETLVVEIEELPADLLSRKQ